MLFNDKIHYNHHGEGAATTIKNEQIKDTAHSGTHGDCE